MPGMRIVQMGGAQQEQLNAGLNQLHEGMQQMNQHMQAFAQPFAMKH